MISAFNLEVAFSFGKSVLATLVTTPYSGVSAEKKKTLRNFGFEVSQSVFFEFVG